MKHTDFCPYCSQPRPIDVKVVEELYRVRGEDISEKHSVSVCTVCGNEFVTAEQADQGLKASYEKYRTAHGIITPEDIVQLRSQYGASQKAFGTILGFGELTINSYEQGSLPSEAHQKILDLAKDHASFVSFYNKARANLGPTQQKRIEAALSVAETPVIASAQEPYPVRDHSGFAGESASEYNGWTETAWPRVFAMIQAIVRQLRPPIYKMKLLKLMFYADFLHFRSTTHSISGLSYARLPYGPVPDDYEDLLRNTVRAGVIDLQPDGEERGDLISLGSRPSDDANQELSPRELESVTTVCTKLGHRSATELSNITHQEEAWIKTAHAARISYEHAITLKAV